MRIKIIGTCLLILGCLAACGPSDKKSADTQNNAAALSNTERQYFSNGKGLYDTYCANCHMDQGQGLGQLIPPLKDSDYLMRNVPAAAAYIKNGLKGKIMVNGKEYDQPMPANPKLTPLEIAEILTFISNSWGNEHGGVSTEEVKQVLER